MKPLEGIKLSNVIERMVIIAESNTIRIKDLPESFFSVDYFGDEIAETHHEVNDFAHSDSGEETTFTNSMEEHQREIIIEAYKKYPSSRKLAAALNISQSTGLLPSAAAAAGEAATS